MRGGQNKDGELEIENHTSPTEVKAAELHRRQETAAPVTRLGRVRGVGREMEAQGNADEAGIQQITLAKEDPTTLLLASRHDGHKRCQSCSTVEGSAYRPAW